MTEKKTEEVKVWMTESLKAELKILAARAGHDSLSPFIFNILHKHVRGHLTDESDLLAGLVKD